MSTVFPTDSPHLIYPLIHNLAMVIITGPTASGKTGRAVDLARTLHAEIVSADSRQVYRGMDIGSGKDLDEYGEVPYHLIDIVDAGEVYNLFRFLEDARQAIASIEARGHEAIVCGGSGMYVEALARGTSLPEVPRNEELRLSLAGKSLEELCGILASMKTLHNTTDTDTRARAVRAIEIQSYYAAHPEIDPTAPMKTSPSAQPLIIGVEVDRDTRRARITRRLDERLRAGMVDEVSRLLERGVDPQILINYGLEYRFVTRHLLGELSEQEMRSGLEIAIHQFAKRQMTWFRGMERRGFKIHWLPAGLTRTEFSDRVISLMRR